jgi:hypothetical protein
MSWFCKVEAESGIVSRKWQVGRQAAEISNSAASHNDKDGTVAAGFSFALGFSVPERHKGL